MKAMILAAGRGERMRPLTDKIPKPLVSIGPELLVEHTLKALKNAGITEIVINVCYRAKQIINTLGDGSAYGMQITYSMEEGGALGTGGGIYHALPLLGPDPFIVVSADIWSNFPFQKLVKEPQHDVYLVMVPNPSYYPKGDYALTTEGELTLGSECCTYAGISVLHPRIFAAVDQNQKTFSLAPILEQTIISRRAMGEVYQGAWYNVGTLQQLALLQQQQFGLFAASSSSSASSRL